MEQKKRSAWLALLVAVLFVVPLSGVSQATAGKADQSPQQRPKHDYLVQRAREDGTVRVIVGLDLSGGFRPEGDLVDAAAIRAQRSAISTVQQKLLDRLSRHNVDSYAIYRAIPYVALRVDSSGLEALLALPFVRSVQEDTLMRATLLSSTSVIGAPNVWASGFDGAGQAVVILDTGIDANHPFFGGRVVHEACFSNAGGSGDWVSLCPNGMPTQYGSGAANATATQCWNGGQSTQLCAHGSHVAGIAAGSDYGGGPGYSGVAPGADIIAIQVFTRFDDPSFCSPDLSCVASYSSDQIAAMDYVYSTLHYSYTIASVNMSLGGGFYSNQAYCDDDNAATKAAIDNLRSVDIATVIAAGNAYWTDAMEAPGCISSAVSVGATTDLDGVASFSNMHDMVDLLAPGVSIDSSIPDDTYATYQGTSMATPHVAGAWAILKSVDPSASVDDVLGALQDTGVSVTDGRAGGSVTKPRIQLDAAVTAIRPAVWQGGSSSLWSDLDNWDIGAVPRRANRVTIPSAPTGGGFPVIDVDARVRALVVETGARVDMGSNELVVSGDWDVQGTGVFSATGGTVVLGGATTQTIAMSAGVNGQFFNLEIGDGSAVHTVVLNSNLDVDGDVTIWPGSTLAAGPHTISVAGDWIDDGLFLPGNGVLALSGATQAVRKRGATVFPLGPEGFESTSLPTDWAMYKTGHRVDPGWQVGSAGTVGSHGGPHSGTNYVWHNDDNLPAAAISWLRTPQVSLPSAGRATLSFWHRSVWPDYYDYHGVWVCTGACDDPPTNYVELWKGNVGENWLRQEVDLSAYAGQNAYLAFRYVGDFADEWYVDDVSVYGPVDWAGSLEFYNLAINGTDVVVFNGDVQVNGDLFVGSHAVMDLGTHDIIGVGGAVTNHGGLRQTKDLLGGTTMAFMEIGTDKYYGVDIYSPSGDMGATTVTVYGNQARSGGGGMVQRCFEISPATPQVADITFYYRDAEENGQDAAQVWHWSGSAWEQQAFGGRDRTGVENNWVQATGVTSYSPFALSNEIPTAVKVVSLRAVPDGDSILVTWETATELDNVGFNLYRSQSSDSQYVRINEALVPSQSPGTTLGAVYAWRDRDVQPGGTYYYVLEDVDINGVRTIHGPVEAVLALHNVSIYLPIVGRGY